MSQELGKALKRIYSGHLEAAKMADLLNAVVVEAGPEGPVIQLENSEGPLPAPAVIVPEQFKAFTVKVSGEFHGEEHSGELTVDNSLKEGDRLYVIRKSGAQKYFVAGRV